MSKFLIIQTAFLGDVILATPVVSELRKKYPSAQIDIVVRKGNESLLDNHKDINSVLIWNKKDGKYKSLRKLIKQIRKTEYTEIINLHRFASSGMISLFSKAKSKVGFDKNPLSRFYTRKIEHKIGDGSHEVERNLQLISHHDVAKVARPSLYPSQEQYKKVESYKVEKYVCFSPASVWFTKQLPLEKWVELGKSLNDLQIYLLGGPGDKELCETLRAQLPKAINLAGELSLLESAALIDNAERSYVNDSGPLHISSAMNTPTTAFFCSTIQEFGFGPLAEKSEIKSLMLDCKPCGLHGFKSCPKGHFNCGKNIEI